MPDHEHFIGKTIDEYFVTVSLGKDKFTVDEFEYIPFERFNCSAMGRGALVVVATERATMAKWCFMTSHLESMKELGANRMKQFSELVKLAEKYSEHKVVFGGDFNMRDKELNSFVSKSSFFQENIRDMWDGSNETKFTWDLLLNDNKKLPFTARCRFDRLYCNKNVFTVDFKLAGMTKIQKCPLYDITVNRFVSDHFAITASIE